MGWWTIEDAYGNGAAQCLVHTPLPTLMVYDRGGSTGDPEGSGSRGCQTDQHPAQGQPGVEAVPAEAVRETVRSERGKTEGIIGTLKTDKYGIQQALWVCGTRWRWPGLGPHSLLQSEQVHAGSCVQANR